jgi:hypothetical protein
MKNKSFDLKNHLKLLISSLFIFFVMSNMLKFDTLNDQR